MRVSPLYFYEGGEILTKQLHKQMQNQLLKSVRIKLLMEYPNICMIPKYVQPE